MKGCLLLERKSRAVFPSKMGKASKSKMRGLSSAFSAFLRTLMAIKQLFLYGANPIA
jgi:hypothetical protein